MAKIYIVQHCQSEHHINELTGGWTDMPLTELGQKQAKAVANELKRLGLKEFKLVSSDLKRAYMTAEVISKTFGMDIIKDAKLREHNNGDAAFKTKTWAEENKNHFSQNELIDNPLWRNAETFRDLFNRVTQFKKAYLVDLKEDLVIVSHGVAIGYLMMSFLGLKAENLVNVAIRGNAGGISILSKSQFAQNTLNKYNSTNHLN